MCFFLISIACPIDTSTFVSPRVYFVHFTSHSNYIANCVLRLINIFVHQRVCRFVVLRLFERPRRNIFFLYVAEIKRLCEQKKLVTWNEYLTIVFLPIDKRFPVYTLHIARRLFSIYTSRRPSHFIRPPHFALAST